MADIIKGVPDGYVPPAQSGEPAGGIAIGATSDRQLRVTDRSNVSNSDLLMSIEELLRHIRLELMLNNENMFPTVNFENERKAVDRMYNDPRGYYSNATDDTLM